MVDAQWMGVAREVAATWDIAGRPEGDR